MESREPRLPLSLCVHYLDRGEYLSQWTENLSAGGLFVRTDRPLLPGARVPLRISFPGLLAPLDLAGEVVWVREAQPGSPGGVGLRVAGDRTLRRLAELALTLRALGPSTARYRVLVVEDNPLVVGAYRRALKHLAARSGHGVEIELCEDGFAALRAAAADPAQLVITDLCMPLMNGLQLIEQLQAGPAPRPTILVVTCAPEDDVRRALELGVDGLLRKPIQFGQLLETIVGLLALRARAPA
jgi:uncharacterized protein (TIGR02266 family)